MLPKKISKKNKGRFPCCTIKFSIVEFYPATVEFYPATETFQPRRGGCRGLLIRVGGRGSRHRRNNGRFAGIL